MNQIKSNQIKSNKSNKSINVLKLLKLLKLLLKLLKHTEITTCRLLSCLRTQGVGNKISATLVVTCSLLSSVHADDSVMSVYTRRLTAKRHLRPHRRSRSLVRIKAERPLPLSKGF